MAEDEVDIAEFGADCGVVRAEAEAGEVFGAEVGGDGFQAVVPSARAFSAETGLAERQVEIIANDRDVFGWDFVEMGESLDGFAGIIIESLWFDEDSVAVFIPKSIILRSFPVEMMNFGIKI